jgi:SAM-dependent methyltransferase
VDARYWEGIGKRYEDEVFASSLADRDGVIRRRLDELANERAVAIDFGCGVGHYLPLLARRFRAVHGVDFAESLLEQARARCGPLSNVSIERADLASGRAKLATPLARVAVCANVLISADARRCRGILRTIHRHLLANGRLLLIVPSLESALLANLRLVEWNRRLGLSEREALASGIAPTARGASELLQGLVRIEEVPTRHYLREELEGVLGNAGFAMTSCEKIEYSWETEFDDPPRWMKPPGPWDWLIVGRKVTGKVAGRVAGKTAGKVAGKAAERTRKRG